MKYIAFLRGINVGNIRIKMSDLQIAFEDLGYTQVKTFLQTGNVVFESENEIAIIKENLEEKLTQTFHYEAFVLMYCYADLEKIIVAYPFEKEENCHDYVLFVEKENTLRELQDLSQNLSENIKIGEGVVYWKVAKGNTLDAPFSKIIAKAKYKSTTTMRNINTLEKMK